MNELPIPELKRHVEASHNCTAEFLKTEPVIEKFKGQVVWDGEVNIFKLKNHPKAELCYIWTNIDDDNERKFYIVLGLPPVNSALDAVRVSIVGDNQS